MKLVIFQTSYVHRQSLLHLKTVGIVCSHFLVFAHISLLQTERSGQNILAVICDKEPIYVPIIYQKRSMCESVSIFRRNRKMNKLVYIMAGQLKTLESICRQQCYLTQAKPCFSILLYIGILRQLLLLQAYEIVYNISLLMMTISS